MNHLILLFFTILYFFCFAGLLPFTIQTLTASSGSPLFAPPGVIKKSFDFLRRRYRLPRTALFPVSISTSSLLSPTLYFARRLPYSFGIFPHIPLPHRRLCRSVVQLPCFRFGYRPFLSTFELVFVRFFPLYTLS